MNRYILAILIAALFLAACDNDEPQLSGPMPLVVEGWIEEGAAPIVMVTRAVNLTTDTASFDGFVEKWARVSVFDDGVQYILTGKVNKDYMPPFVFTSTRLRGRQGHTYRLLVETDIDTVEATATLLPPPDLTSLKAVLENAEDSVYSIRAFLSDITPEGCYKFFARDIDNESRFFGSFLGTFRGYEYKSDEGWTVTAGVHTSYDSDDYSHYYPSGSRITVKACSLAPELYDFWSVYDANISLSQNIFFTFAGNCPSNIQGGLGYWAAYGVSQRSIKIP